MNIQVSLTLSLDVNDPAFLYLENPRKINSGEIRKPNFPNVSQVTEWDRTEDISKVILDSNQNLLIGFAIESLEDLRSLKNRLEGSDIKVDKLYLPSPERLQNNLKNAIDFKKTHGRWLDYSVGFIEVQYDKHKELIQQLKQYSKGHKIEAIEL